MSLLANLINSLTGGDGEDFTPPSSLCPGNCAIGPEACAECLPYKERLKDALYNVEHLEEFNARYEVVSTLASGFTTCPHCLAPSADRFVCEYCGMQIAEDDGKIRVTSANDIPDPIIEARDIVYDRHSEVVDKYSKDSSSGGLLSSLLDLLDGENDGDGLGKRMSKEEISEAAALYGVSVSAYLNGLDNGTYLTLSEKKQADSVSSVTSVGGAAVAGGILGQGGSLFTQGGNLFTQGGSLHPQQRPARRPGTPPRPDFVQRPQSTFSNRPGHPGMTSNPPQAGHRPQQNDRKPLQDDRKPQRDDRKPQKDDRKPQKDSRKPLQDDRKPLQDDRKPLQNDRKPTQGVNNRPQGARKPTQNVRGPRGGSPGKK